MKKAILQSKKAERLGEIPIGAIIVKDGAILARGYNKREAKMDATCHAEIIAIKKACKKLNNWRLSGCTMYVTLEPCAMCAGAILNARIDRVVFGAHDLSSGACGSALDVFSSQTLNHSTEILGGILEDEISSSIKSFFKMLRKKK